MNIIDVSLESDTECKKRKLPIPIVSECSICCENWTTAGSHRIVSLSCGHLYGKACIERWISKRKTCPHCMKRMKVSEIRPLYTDQIAMQDTSALEELETYKKKERKRKNQADAEMAQLKIQHQLLLEDHKGLQEKMKSLTDKACHCKPLKEDTEPLKMDTILDPFFQRKENEIVKKDKRKWKYMPLHKVATGGQSRVFAMSKDAEMTCIGISTMSKDYQHGICKLNTMHPKHTSIIGIHSQPVRDIDITAHNGGLALTTSCDGSTKITSLISDSVVMQYPMKMAGWSCAWDPHDTNYMYVGGTLGKTLQFDLRQTRGYLNVFQNDPPTPIHSVVALKQATTRLLSGSFARIGNWSSLSTITSTSEMLPLPFTGTALCLSSNALLCNHILVSSRNSSATGVATHAVMDISDPAVPLHTWSGHRVPIALSRSCLWTLPSKEMIVASGNDKDKTVSFWTPSAPEPVFRLQTGSTPILDVQHVVPYTTWDGNNTAFLGALSCTELQLFQYRAVK